MINLYDDQMQLVNRARKKLGQGVKSLLIQAETGSGKTVMSAYMIKQANQKGNRCAFVVPRKELLRQTKKTWKKFDIPHSQVAAGNFFAPDSMNHLCTMQTLVKRLDKIDPQIIFIDETHFGAGQLDTIINHFKSLNKFVIGLSATPKRGDGKGLGCWYDDMVNGETLEWLIANNRLSDYRMFSISRPDLSGVRTVNGDYSKSQLSEVMENNKVIVGDAVNHYIKHAMGKRHMTFSHSIKQSRMMCDAFNAAGVPSEHIDGDTPDADRKKIIMRYATGQTLNLCSVDMLLFGFDLSAQVDMEVPVESMSDCRPTKSITLQRQKIGRVLRYKDYPALIFDHAGNALRHGLPCDEMEWSLADDKKKNVGGERAAAMKTCDECLFFHRPAPVCPNCGYKYPPPSPEEIEQVDGELEEIKKQRIRRQKRYEEAMCKTLEDWQALAKERGNKPRWATIRHAMRKKKEEKAEAPPTLF